MSQIIVRERRVRLEAIGDIDDHMCDSGVFVFID